MQRHILFLVLLSTAHVYSQEPAATPTTGLGRTANETNELVAKLLNEAQDLQGRKRFLDALAKLDEAEKVRPDNPAIFNMRGAIYLASQVRDVEKAREQFRVAMKMQPDQMPPAFNMTEVDFVSGKWEQAEAGLAEVAKRFPKLPASIRHLIEFKRIICFAKQNKLKEASAILEANFTFMDDTPAYLFAKSALAFTEKKEQEANDWLLKAQTIFKPADNSAYLDSLMESGYIHSLAVPNPGGDTTLTEPKQPE